MASASLASSAGLTKGLMSALMAVQELLLKKRVMGSSPPEKGVAVLLKSRPPMASMRMLAESPAVSHDPR